VNTGQPVQIQVKGEDYEQLQTLAENITNELEEVDGLVGMTNSIERTSIEKVIELDHEAMEDSGLTEMELRTFIQEAFLHMPISEINTNDHTLPLVATWQEEMVTEEQLLDMTIPTALG